MRLSFAASFAKYQQDSRLNEDAVGERASHGVYAVSDGASESFDSRRWSKLLVQLFLADAHVDERWVRRAVTLYARQFDREAMSWSAQAAFDRGSFATLTGILISPPGSHALVLGIGDSLAVLADGKQIVSSHPYQQPEQFAQRPLLLATVWEQNRALLGRALRNLGTRWSLRRLRDASVLLMTDALGAWLLRDPRSRLPKLLNLNTPRQFEALVERERVNGRMRRDDTTLVVIR
jgi:hypothetical protein